MTYLALLAGYSASAAMLLALILVRQSEWPTAASEAGLRPVLVLGLLVAVIAIGQLFQAGWLIPANPEYRVLARVGNQLLIFSPVFATALIAAGKGTAYARRVAFMPTDRVAFRLAVGLGAAAFALVVHQLVVGRIARIGDTIAQLATSEHLSHAVQILGEDLAITMLLASVLRWTSPRVAILSTGSLFALGHVPTMLQDGAQAIEFVRLVADGLLAAGVCAVLFRLRDVWLVWPVHVAMDLTQFIDAR